MKKLLILILLAICAGGAYFVPQYLQNEKPETVSYAYGNIPAYNSDQIIVINGDETDLYVSEAFKTAKLDDLGRAVGAEARITKKSLPRGQRGSIGHLKPSGWNQAKYPEIINSEPPYYQNRCHLVCWSSIGDQSNVIENIISGTRSFNMAMLEVEKEVLHYVESHPDATVMYRVTPVYTGDNLMANGVYMEARSEDGSFQLYRYVYNIEDGLEIDYKTGKSRVKN